MAEVITDRAHITPAWLTETLRRGGHLPQGSAAEISLETFHSFFADFYRMEIGYSADAQPALQLPPARMILKVPFANPPSLEMGQNEVFAYRKLHEIMPDPPFPRCFDAVIDEATGRSHLLLEDLSPTHFCGNAKEEISLRQWEHCVEALADLHAFWWESEALGEIGAPMLTAAEIDNIEARMKNDLPKFFAEMGDEITPPVRAAYEKALAFLPGFWRGRYTTRRRCTLIHGDAHSWNFLFPRDGENGRAFMIDLATLRPRPPVNDLAYLMALKWTRDFRSQFEMPLLRHYHRALESRGIKEYPWEDLLLDYRHAILTQMFTPVGQCSWEYLSPGIWQANFRRISAAYEDLNCEELL